MTEARGGITGTGSRGGRVPRYRAGRVSHQWNMNVTFQMAEVAVPRELFQKILSLIDDLRRRPVPA